MRPYWVLHELGLDYEMHLIGSRTGETKTPEFRTLKPRGKTPVLQEGNGMKLGKNPSLRGA